MITLEETIQILTKDHNFREIIFGNHYSLDWPENPQFKHISFDSSDVDQDTLFLPRERRLKKNTLSKLFKKG